MAWPASASTLAAASSALTFFSFGAAGVCRRRFDATGVCTVVSVLAEVAGTSLLF
jgi:hypothetical protein